MVNIESRLMNSHGHVYTSRVSDEDQMTVVMRHFFFTQKHGEISTLHHESNGDDLKALIHILALHLSH